MCLSECLSITATKPLLTVIKFGINVHDSKADEHVYKDFIFLSRLKITAVLWVSFAVTGVEQGIVFIELQVQTLVDEEALSDGRTGAELLTAVLTGLVD